MQGVQKVLLQLHQHCRPIVKTLLHQAHLTATINDSNAAQT